MSRRAPRLILRIDRVTVEGGQLDRRALETALRAELGRMLERPEGAALQTGMDRAGLRLELPAGKAPLAERVASATAKAISS